MIEKVGGAPYDRRKKTRTLAEPNRSGTRKRFKGQVRAPLPEICRAQTVRR